MPKSSAVIIDAHGRLQLIFALAHLEKIISDNKKPDFLIITKVSINNQKKNFSDIKQYIENLGVKNIQIPRKKLLKISKNTNLNYTYVISSSLFPINAIKALFFSRSKIKKIILIEEGIGSYCGGWAKCFSLHQTGFTVLGIRALIAQPVSEFLAAIKVFYNSRLISKNYTVNNHLKKQLKYVISKLSVIGLEEHLEGFTVLALVSNEIEIDEILRIYKKEKILFKPHPHFFVQLKDAEIIRREYSIYSGERSAEELVARGDFKRIVGYNSSALVYCKILYSIDAVNLSPERIKDRNARRIFDVTIESKNHQ